MKESSIDRRWRFCKDCIYFRPIYGHTGHAGYCHRYPEVIFKPPKDSCGEWKAK